MRKLNVYNFITLNGCFKGPGGDLSWHRHGEEEAEYAAGAQRPDTVLLFGRVTYQMMAGYWPTPAAMQNAPAVAENMNKAQKIVFSNTLEKAGWANTTVIGGNIVEQVKALKAQPGGDMTILGSGSIVTQFAEQGLIDTFEIMLDPVVLAKGTPIFEGITRSVDLKLTGSRAFKSGVVLLSYEVMKELLPRTPHGGE